MPRAELLDAVSLLVRATLSPAASGGVLDALRKLGVELSPGEADALLDRARVRLPDLARWLEENGRELLERA